MRVAAPLAVQVRGWLTQVHEFRSEGQVLAELAQPVGSPVEHLRLQDGARFELACARRWLAWLSLSPRPLYYFWQGEVEQGRATPDRFARHAELVYGAAPYFIVPAQAKHEYHLIGEADTDTLTISFRGPLRREASLRPQIALDMALAALAYVVARHLV